MNEEEWLVCADPAPMLNFLQERNISERKLRLLACACCRLIWDLLPDRRSREAIEVVERFADGKSNVIELAQARNAALEASGRAERQAAWAAYWVTNAKPGGPLENVFSTTVEALARRAAQQATSGQAAA